MKFFSTQLFRITTLNALSVVIKMAIGLITSKVIALFIGPLGMGLVGNMRNFLTAVESWSTLGFQNGIVKYVAEYKTDEIKITRIISTVFIALTGVVMVTSIGLFIFADAINQLLFGNIFQYQNAIKLLAFVLPWYAYSMVLMSVLNGLGNFKNVIRINIIGNLMGLLVSVGLIIQWKTIGAVSALILTPSLLFFVALYYLQKEMPFWKYVSWEAFDFLMIKKLSSYSFMFFVSAVIGPLVFLEIRNYVIEMLGNNAAGYWEAMNRISTYYLMFITTLIGVYFFPQLSVTKSVEETRRIFWRYYQWIVSLFIVVLLGIYLFREWIIKLLFTEAFLPVNELFFWQLTGDIFKAASLILGYQFLAKKMTKHFVITEMMSLSISYFSSMYFIPIFKIQGVVMAHALTYVVYFLVLVLVFRKTLFGVRNSKLLNNVEQS